MTGTNLMPSGAVETFTGSNGSTPSTTNTTVAINEGSGGGISIQGNQLRIRTGTTQLNRTSTRITGVSVSDAEVVFDWVVQAVSSIFMGVFMRANSAIDSGHGYYFSLQPNDMTVTRFNPTLTYSGSSLVTNTHGFTVGQTVRTRIALFGTRIRVRSWLASNPETTNAWQIDYTDTGGFTTAGFVGFTASSATAGSKDAFYDNIDLWDTVTPTQAILAAGGSIGPTGALIKRPGKSFIAAITPTGALVKGRAVTRTFTAAITPTGALAKALPRLFAGAVTPTGILKRSPMKNFVAAVTPSGLVRRIANRSFAGSITPTGDFATTFLGRVFGRPGIVVMKLIQRAEIRIRHRKG